MNTIYAERLAILADHLEHGQLGHSFFNFGAWNVGPAVTPSGCGTAGCAIGECPIVFPEEWSFHPKTLAPGLHEEKQYFTPETSGCLFFSLTEIEFGLLFMPYADDLDKSEWPDWYERLTAEATREQVAENIWKFLEHERGRSKASFSATLQAAAISRKVREVGPDTITSQINSFRSTVGRLMGVDPALPGSERTVYFKGDSDE